MEGRPRLAVFRSHLHIYAQVGQAASTVRLLAVSWCSQSFAQVIDDTTHNTLVSASTLQPAIKQELNNKGSTKVQDAPVCCLRDN